MKPLILALLGFLLLAADKGTRTIDSVCLSQPEQELHTLIMEYRKSKKFPPIALSSKLTQVAQLHAKDLSQQYTKSNRCNFHSWSKKGNWTSCCYTADHKEAACMWNKPKEIAGYESNGFEIAYWSSAGANAKEALDGWKTSAGHNSVIVNLGIWKNIQWKAIGIGISGEYGVVWFGELADDTSVSACDSLKK